MGYPVRARFGAAALVPLLAVSSPAHAQLDEIVVTGARIGGDDYSGVPAVTVEKRADFLVQRIRITNDTRAVDGRQKEIRATLRDLIVAAAREPGIALAIGDDFLVPLTSAAQDLPLTGGKRADTTTLEINVKKALGPKDDVAQAIERLEKFIETAKVTGRTEIEDVGGDVALSIVNPERYRFEIIGRIAEDAKRLQGTLGAKCRIEIEGLERRVTWQRTDVSELTLYIPYRVNLSDCE